MIKGTRKALVSHANARVGAIATQGQTNPILEISGLQLLEQRLIYPSFRDRIASAVIIQILLQDDQNSHRASTVKNQKYE